MKSFAEAITIGRFVKPQGRKGEVKVEPYTDRENRFPRLARAFVPAPGGGSREVEIEGCWPHKDHFVLKLRGVDSITQAEALRDAELGIPESELETLPPGSYYYHQLSGLEVVDERGALLGTVASVMETGAETRVLVVQGPRGETLLPFAEEFVRSVDLVHGVLAVVRPEYVDAD